MVTVSQSMLKFMLVSEESRQARFPSVMLFLPVAHLLFALTTAATMTMMMMMMMMMTTTTTTTTTMTMTMLMMKMLICLLYLIPRI